MGITFDYIVVCTVTGSAHAGMVVGFAEDGRARSVIGIDASATPKQTHTQVLRIAQNAAEKVDLGQEITADDVALKTEYAYPNVRRPIRRDQRGDSALRARKA